METKKIIDRNTIHENLNELLPQHQIEQVSPFINLAVKALGGEDCFFVELTLPDRPSMPKWNKDYLTRDIAARIHGELSKVDVSICVRCPLHVQKTGSQSASPSYFDIFLSKDVLDIARKPLFVREGITISEDRVPRVRGYTSMVVIGSGDLATLLGDSENPAHTEWEKNSTKFKGKYRWGPTTIDFVRLSVGKFLNLMSQGDDEEDVSILSDIFYLDFPENEEEVPISRKREVREKPGSDTEPPIEPPPPPRSRTYRLTKSQDGFVVKSPINPSDELRKYKVTVAYDFVGASKARAMGRYHKNDFDLSTRKNVDLFLTEGMNDVVVGGNTVEFKASISNFKLEVNGFDCRRDIIVDVASERWIDEAV